MVQWRLAPLLGLHYSLSSKQEGRPLFVAQGGCCAAHAKTQQVHHSAHLLCTGLAGNSAALSLPQHIACSCAQPAPSQLARQLCAGGQGVHVSPTNS